MKKRLYIDVIDKYEEYKIFKKNMELHKELKEIKLKIELCQFNNEKYHKYSKRKIEILKELGYNAKLKKRKGTRRSLDYKDSFTGHIKVYRF